MILLGGAYQEKLSAARFHALLLGRPGALPPFRVATLPGRQLKTSEALSDGSFYLQTVRLTSKLLARKFPTHSL